MNTADQYLLAKLEEREQQCNLRKLSTDRAPIDFYSNDYLGFVTEGILLKKMQQYHSSLTTGATGSRLLSGNSLLAEALERGIATFHQTEAALIFNSGYDANIGLLSGIADRHTTFIYDELCHASIIDGIRLSHADKYKFRHNDLNELEKKVKMAKPGHIFIVVESVYSMDGDMAPLQEIVKVAEKYNVAIIVDEAHATGVFGKKGEGIVQQLGLQGKIFARVHTFGKALGCHGAAVVGSKQLKEYLVNFARSFIYTTALPEHSLKCIECAYEYLESSTFSSAPLHSLIEYFRSKITGNSWKDSISPIQTYVISGNAAAKELATRIQQAGLQVNAILHPTVPAGEERLRICLHIYNTPGQVDKLMEVINNE